MAVMRWRIRASMRERSRPIWAIAQSIRRHAEPLRPPPDVSKPARCKRGVAVDRPGAFVCEAAALNPI